MTRLNKKELYGQCLARFAEAMPEADTELHYTDHWQLLVAVMLSAQCTDRRVNEVTPALFAAFPSPEATAAAGEEAVFEKIRSISYPRSKARHLVATAQMIAGRFGGRVPQTREELESLPGVGRKTASVVLAVAFGRAEMAVDTHVFRVSRRIGLASERCRTPLAVEQELVRHIPEELIPKAHHWLILHGRYVCTARRPQCDACCVRELCRFRRRQQEKGDTPAVKTPHQS